MPIPAELVEGSQATPTPRRRSGGIPAELVEQSEGRSALEDYAYGAIPQAAGAINWIARRAYPPLGLIERGRAFAGVPEPSAAEIESAVSEATGITPPETFEGRVRANTAAGMMVTAPVAAASTPVLAALEMMGAAFGPRLGAALERRVKGEELGEEPSALFEGLGGLAVSPVGVVTNVARGAARRAAGLTPEIRALSQRLGVPEGTAVDVAGDYKAVYPRDPSGQERFIQQAIEDQRRAITDEGQLRTVQATRPGLVQENLIATERSVADMPAGRREFLADIEGQQQIAQEIAQQRADELVRSAPDVSQIGTEGQAGARAVRRAATEAWRPVDPELDRILVDAPRITDTARDVVAQKGVLGAEPPEIVRRLADITDEMMPMREVQAARKQLTALERAADLNPALEPQAQQATRVRIALDEVVDAIPEERFTEEYRAALGATARKKELTRPRSAAMRTINKIASGEIRRDEIREVGAELLSSRAAARQMRTLLEEAGGDVQNARNIIARSLFSEDMFDTQYRRTPRQVRTILENNRDSLAEWFDADELAALERHADFFRQVDSGRWLGGRSGILGTGSAREQTGALTAPASSLREGGQAVLNYVANRVRKMDREARALLWQDIFMDPRTSVALLESPTPRSIAAWRIAWDQALLRAEARAAVRGVQESEREAARAAGG